jgi:hypothetical protein
VLPHKNIQLQSCNKREASQLVCVIVTVFIIYVTFSNYSADVFSLQSGYSFVWLLLLYIIGAWMKKCDVPNYLKNSTLSIGIVACILFAWILKVYFFNDILINYTSLNTVFIAFALVSVFSKVHLKGVCKKFVSCFAPAAFGVYLIHEEPSMRAHFITDAFTWIADLACWQLVIAVLVSAFCIFVCCLMVEKIRLILFRYFKIDKLIDKIATAIENLVLKIYSKCVKAYE